MTVFSDATNTGVPAGVTLTPSGGLTITTPGAVISGLNISGTVTIDAPNVTLKDCTIQGIGYYQVLIEPGITGTTVENCTINAGGNGTNPYALCGIGDNGSNSTFLNNNISNFEHGISLINSGGNGDLIQGNYLHDFNAPAALQPHYDGIEINGPESNVSIIGNTIINNQDNSCIMIDNYFGSISNIKVDGNLLVGGTYNIFVDAQFNSNPITNVSVTNNHYGTSQYGFIAINDNSPTVTGNINDGNQIALTLGHQGSAQPAIVSFAPNTGAVGDGITDANKLTLTGTASSSDTVTVSDGSTAIGTVTSDASGNWTLPTAALADGKHSFTATTTDGGTSAALVVTVDTHVPAAPVVASFSPNTGGIDTTNQVNLVGTAEANSTVTVFDGSTNLGTATADASGAWSFPESNAANGIHTFTATATDVAGMTGPASAPLNVTVNAPLNLVVNGGFDTGKFTGWTIGSYQPDQTIITTNSEAGAYAAALGPASGDGSLSQSIPTTAGQQYTLTFWLANMSSGPDDFTAKWNGNAVLALVNAPAQGYTEYTFTVTATGSTSNLEFDYRQDPTQWRLDSVSVTPVGTQGTTPTVAVSINNNDVNVANGTGTVTFAFSAAPATFVLADTGAVGGTLSNLQKTDATHYTATFTAAANTDIANASVSVTAGSWQSNGTAGAGGSTPTFTVDTVTPTVAVSINNTDVNVANGTGTVTFAFSEAPVAFTLADTSAVGGTLSNLQKTDATHYTATFTGAANTDISNASVSVTAGSWQEGNGNAGAGGSTAAFTVNTVSPDLDGPEAPVLTINSQALTVNAGGSISLPIGVTAVDSDDTISVKITGLTKYETITDNLDHKVFRGRSVTLTAAEVNSGLTLNSTYGGSGHPVNTLTVTASNSTPGETGTSAAQTIKVTDPPAGSTSSDGTPTLGAPPAWGGNAGLLAALLTQYAAAGFQSESKSGFGGGVITTTPKSESPFDHNDPVLTKPMH
jgi:hypothetical protein